MSKDASYREVMDILLKGYVSPREMGSVIGASTSSVLQMINRGEIRSIRVGYRIRIYRDEVHRFIKEGNFKDVD